MSSAWRARSKWGSADDPEDREDARASSVMSDREAERGLDARDVEPDEDRVGGQPPERRRGVGVPKMAPR